MRITRFFPALAAIGAALLYTCAAQGQAYPSKPVRIVTTAIGGSPDFVSRLIAQGITAAMGQPVVIDNRTSGVIPGETVSNAAPDGYTVLCNGGSLWILSLLRKTPYDPVRDFAPITLVLRAPNVLVVHPSLPVRSVKDLIALAKARPGELNYGSATPGGSAHLSAELFKSMARINVVHIPYKSTPLAVTDLVAGRVQIQFESPAAVDTYMKSSRLRAIASTSAEPSALLPGLPTVAASGLPGYESAQLAGMFAPAKTPPAIVRRLNEEIVRYLRTPDATEKFFNVGVEAAPTTPEQFASIIAADVNRWGKVIREAGIKLEN